MSSNLLSKLRSDFTFVLGSLATLFASSKVDAFMEFVRWLALWATVAFTGTALAAGAGFVAWWLATHRGMGGAGGCGADKPTGFDYDFAGKEI